jgi:hypothetical protein
MKINWIMGERQKRKGLPAREIHNGGLETLDAWPHNIVIELIIQVFGSIQIPYSTLMDE